MRAAGKYKVLLMIWLLQFVNYLDRINLSIAAPTMMRGLKLNPNVFGFILAAFTFGYAIAQIPGGYLADRFGARCMLIASPILWSVFTGMTGFASTLIALVAVRVLFGASEGLSNGASFKLIGDNFASHERSAANAAYLSALALGPAFIAPVAVWFLTHTGWQGMFRWLSLPGLVMALLIRWVIPKQSPTARVYRTSLSADGPRKGLREIVRQPTSWLIFVAYLAFNVAFWAYLGWMPSYLSIARHIDLKALGVAASIPYLFGAAGMIAFGWIGSRSLYRYRCLLIAVIYICTAVSLYVTYNLATSAQSIAGLSVSAFFLYGGFGPVWSVVLDLTPENLRGAFSGFVNLGGQVGGFFAPIVVGYAVSATGSFTGGFLFMIAALFISALCFTILHTVRKGHHHKHISRELA
ncbi:MFS transporter [Paraburkholderia sp. SIMBA_049]